MINTLSKINLSKIVWEGGGSTSIWIMSLNILFVFFDGTPKKNSLSLVKLALLMCGIARILQKICWSYNFRGNLSPRPQFLTPLLINICTKTRNLSNLPSEA